MELFPTALSPGRPRRLAAAVLTAALALGALAGTAGPAAAQDDPPEVVPCVPVELVAARGTFEPGPLGLVIGDPILAALQGEFREGRVGGYAVDYPADATGGSLPAGVADTVGHLEARHAACPDTRFVLAGYSQGALVISGALGAPAFADSGFPQISAGTGEAVVSVLLFGNPLRKSGAQDLGIYDARARDSCYLDIDPACSPGTDFNDHIRYILGDNLVGADVAAESLWQDCLRENFIFYLPRCKALYWP